MVGNVFRVQGPVPNMVFYPKIQWRSNEMQLTKFEISQQLMLRFE